MKVYIPAAKDENPFFDEIIQFSKLNFEFGNINSFTPDYQIVLIHWPEQLFNWREPSQDELEHLGKNIISWKKHARIVYVVHNLERHYGMNANWEKLYELVLTNADAMIHLGGYSAQLLGEKYPNKQHTIIPHPLYENSFTFHEKAEARKILRINDEKVVVIAPGRIRSDEEATMIKDAFDALDINEKLLVVPFMKKKEAKISFPGRVRLKKVVDVKKLVERFMNRDYKQDYMFSYSFCPFEELSLLLAASDVIFIPRKSVLNSGNLFLGLSYKKVIVGPDSGNVAEALENFGFPTFDGNRPKSIRNALNKAVQLSLANTEYNESKLVPFKPQNVASKWDYFMLETLKSIAK